MAQDNSESNIEQQGKHAAAPAPLTKREQRKAEKAARKAADEAAKQARKAAKAARKAEKRGGGLVAPVASTTAAQTPAERVAAAANVGGPAASLENLNNLPTTIDAADADATIAFDPQLSEHVHVGVVEATDEPLADPAGFVPATAAGAAVSPLSGQEALGKEPAPKRKKKRGKIVAAVLIVLACLVGAGFAGANIYLNNLNQNLAGDEQEAEEVKEELAVVPFDDDPFYMLLVGCDDREGVDGARADTTILARLDPKKNTVTLLSIPRDTAIEIDGYGTEKFNAAYTYGGASGTIAAAKQLCGVDISHYAEVHFEALIDIIDYIGGVDVDVPIAIDDADAGGKVDAGMQHLDGEHAMIFARSRSYTNGDFQRTTSQRLLIEAAAEKVLSMDPKEYPGLLMKVSECMTTDFSVQELLGLAQAFTDEPELKMYSALVPSGTATIDDVSYVITDVEKLEEMMKLIDKGKDPSKVEFEDNTVKTSKEAKKEGIETIVNYGDENYGAAPEGEVVDPYAYDQGYVDYGYDEYADDGYVDDYDDGGDESYDDTGDGGYEE